MSDDYRVVLGSLPGIKGSLRRGITTGTCAQAAAVAATIALLSGEVPSRVRIRLPKSKKAWSGVDITIPVASVLLKDSIAHAVIIKDSGDDVDVTNGMPVEALVRIVETPGVHIIGGRGVGRVTRLGLPVAVGKAAINPVPFAMIRDSVMEVFTQYCENMSGPMQGIEVTIELPRGEELAVKTWNPRIGVEGGLSVIGTSGVIEPASSEAFRRSIWRSAKAFRARGLKEMYISLGYVGESYLKKLGVPDDEILVVGDHVGFSIDACAKLGFSRVHLVAHVGKLTKVAAGIFNTHARFGDARLETLAACAAAEGASAKLIQEILALELAEAAIALVNDAGLNATFTRIAERAAWRSHLRCKLPVSCVVLDLKGNALGHGESL